jgi:hypothetical protein
MLTRTIRYWLFLSLYAAVITLGTYYWYTGYIPTYVSAPLTALEDQVHPPHVHYDLTTVTCSGGRTGTCQQLVRHSVDRHTGATTTVVVDETLTERYEAAGGRARVLALLASSDDKQYFYLEEQFPSSRPRQLYQLAMDTGTLTALPWTHDPFAGDRFSPHGRYVARAAPDFSAVEIFDVFTMVSSTPLRLASSTETLAATDCGFAGKSPNFSWRTDNVLTVAVYAREPETARSCAGPLLRTLTLVVE